MIAEEVIKNGVRKKGNNKEYLPQMKPYRSVFGVEIMESEVTDSDVEVGLDSSTASKELLFFSGSPFPTCCSAIADDFLLCTTAGQ